MYCCMNSALQTRSCQGKKETLCKIKRPVHQKNPPKSGVQYTEKERERDYKRPIQIRNIKQIIVLSSGKILPQIYVRHSCKFLYQG